MLVATDVHYLSNTEARAAALVFERWDSPVATAQYTAMATGFAPYLPGEFFRRELPCLLPLLRDVLGVHAIDTVIVDGYVDLGDGPGLGRHVREALPGIAVVGVAKNPYAGAPAIEVSRRSGKPLFVTAAGVDAVVAAAGIRAMDGAHRLPTLLVKTDHLARGI